MRTAILQISPTNPLEGLREWAVTFLRSQGALVALDHEAEQAAATFLRERDYAIAKNREWESAQAFCQRLGICQHTMIRKLKDPRCPDVHVERYQNGKGRLRAISSNALFDAFCKEGKPITPSTSAQI